ncbi:DUF2726 domain-containing protein [Salipiger pacificus]|nr:DUF2726 domain-containing protein [Alloyangia pacifica]
MNIYTTVALFVFAFIVLTMLTKKKVGKSTSFERRPVMNKPEFRLFKMLRGDLPKEWSLMCQVSYGAFLKNRDYRRYMSINSKRADFIVFNPDMSVVAVIEYQGAGHFGNSDHSRRRADASDKIKRQALSEAEIPLVEVPAKFDKEYVQKLVNALVGPDVGVADDKSFQPAPAREPEQFIAGNELDAPLRGEG